MDLVDQIIEACLKSGSSGTLAQESRAFFFKQMARLDVLRKAAFTCGQDALCQRHDSAYKVLKLKWRQNAV